MDTESTLSRYEFFPVNNDGPPPNELTDQEILDTIAEYRVGIEDITHQLDDDHEEGNPKGSAWRQRARSARRYKERRVTALVEEAQRRGGLGLPPTDRDMMRIENRAANETAAKAKQERSALLAQQRSEDAARKVAQQAANLALQQQRLTFEQQRLEIQLQVEQERTERARVDRDRIDRTRAKGRTKAQLFVIAAYDQLGEDVCAQLWRRAQTMFPNDPAWLKEDA